MSVLVYGWVVIQTCWCVGVYVYCVCVGVWVCFFGGVFVRLEAGCQSCVPQVPALFARSLSLSPLFWDIGLTDAARPAELHTPRGNNVPLWHA